MSVIASRVNSVVEAVIDEIGLEVPRLDESDELLEASAYGATLSEWWTTDGNRGRMAINYHTGESSMRVGGLPSPPSWMKEEYGCRPEGWTFEPGQEADQGIVFRPGCHVCVCRPEL